MKMSTKDICIQSLLIALVAVSTMVFQVPVSATQGYVHLGDSVILLVAVFFGARYGMVAGGVGSMLADVLSGYPQWAIFTLIIKGIMGYLVGRIAKDKKGDFFNLQKFAAVFVGVAWMIFGYYVGGSILTGSYIVALSSIPENAVQGGAGAVIFFVVGYAFHKAKVHEYVGAK